VNARLWINGIESVPGGWEDNAGMTATETGTPLILESGWRVDVHDHVDMRGLHCHVPVPHAGQERGTLLRFEVLGESLDAGSWAFVAEIPVATETGGFLTAEKAEYGRIRRRH
jgi:hypothetical protein